MKIYETEKKCLFWMFYTIVLVTNVMKVVNSTDLKWKKSLLHTNQDQRIKWMLISVRWTGKVFEYGYPAMAARICRLMDPHLNTNLMPIQKGLVVDGGQGTDQGSKCVCRPSNDPGGCPSWSTYRDRMVQWWAHEEWTCKQAVPDPTKSSKCPLRLPLILFDVPPNPP